MAYVTVVIRGCFEQTGYGGRYRVEAGDILVQPTLDRHADRMVSAGIEVLRLPWGFDPGMGGVYHCDAIDEICRLAESDVTAAGQWIKADMASFSKVEPIVDHRADKLLHDMLATPDLSFSKWSDQQGRSREGTSRAFQHLYGVSAAQFRAEARARTAWVACMDSQEPLASLAQSYGFSDQPHLTRSIRHLTGMTPGQWRQNTGRVT